MVKNRRFKYNHSFWYDRKHQWWFNFHNLFFQSLIFRGRKIFAFNFLVKVKEHLKEMEQFDANFVLLIAFMRITPSIMLLALKKGGLVHGVASFITELKKLIYTIRWVVKLLKDKDRIVTVKSVVDLLVSAIYNSGPAIIHKKEIYARSLASRHFIKFLR